MARVFFSVLGTNDYEPCIYRFDDGYERENERFVQVATIGRFCADWTEADRIVIFTTDEAHKKNWLDGGHTNRDGSPKARSGLKSCLETFELNARIEAVRIPDGHTETEIWEIFSILYDCLNEGDTVLFDITHAFRSIPMLALVVVNYAKVMKRINLDGIFYGAFEALGPAWKVREMPMEERRAPVLDLTPLAALLDWTVALDRFSSAGDARSARQLAKASLQSEFRSGRPGEELKAVNKFTERLEIFSKDISTCRGPSIPYDVRRLKESVEAYPEDAPYLPPLKPMLRRLAAELAPFPGNTLGDGVNAARWCLEHNLIQQGYTILMEFLIGAVCEEFGLDPKDTRQRSLVTAAEHLLREKIPPDQWTGEAAERSDAVQAIIARYTEAPRLPSLFNTLGSLRNDINHAGGGPSAVSADRLIESLGSRIEEVESLFAPAASAPSAQQE